MGHLIKRANIAGRPVPLFPAVAAARNFFETAQKEQTCRQEVLQLAAAMAEHLVKQRVSVDESALESFCSDQRRHITMFGPSRITVHPDVPDKKNIGRMAAELGAVVEFDGALEQNDCILERPGATMKLGISCAVRAMMHQLGQSETSF